MENPEEILHSLEEFTKTKPKDIPRELEEYLCFVAKTGDPVYQWPAIKSLFREKMLNVITEFYEACPSVEIPPCPNVDLFNYDVMKTFILEKLDTFAAAPFTLQRLCELLTTPRKEYNRIDKYMRALEKNILVVSTTEPGGRRSTENGEGIMNGLESEHLPETSNSSNDINVEEMDDAPSWPRLLQNDNITYQNDSNTNDSHTEATQLVQETSITASKIPEGACSSSQDTVITCQSSEEPYVSIEPVPSNTCARQDNSEEADVSVTITAIPAGVQKRRNSVEPVVSSETTEEVAESSSSEHSDETTDESSRESNAEENGTSSTQQLEDADSSSSHESEHESAPDKPCDDSSVVASSEEVSQDTSALAEEEVGTSEIIDVVENAPTEQNNSETVAGSEEVTVDTTKCSLLSEESGEKDCSEELEISSSDKAVDEVDSSEAADEVGEKIEETLNEASALNVEEESEAVDESQVSSEQVDVEKVEEKEESSTPMEVDEDFSNSQKVEDVVKAEATSDSTL